MIWLISTLPTPPGWTPPGCPEHSQLWTIPIMKMTQVLREGVNRESRHERRGRDKTVRRCEKTQGINICSCQSQGIILQGYNHLTIVTRWTLFSAKELKSNLPSIGYFLVTIVSWSGKSQGMFVFFMLGGELSFMSERGSVKILVWDTWNSLWTMDKSVATAISFLTSRGEKIIAGHL